MTILDSSTHALAISAVTYDALLVADLAARLAARLGASPVWSGALSSTEDRLAPLLQPDVSRTVLVLAQRLWGADDDSTAADAAVLRGRVARDPSSVLVVLVDDEPLPSWMANVGHCELSVVGVDGVAAFVLRSMGVDGVPSSLEALDAPAVETHHRWPDRPLPFLGQPRAHGALRREFDAICSELEPRFDTKAAHGDGRVRELHKLPHRIIARLDDVGVSFSWVPGRAGTVADGRLMVIEWGGVAAGKGRTALQSAQPVRECVYTAEATSNDDWCWRASGPNGRASSTANLVGEWMAGAAMTAARATA